MLSFENVSSWCVTSRVAPAHYRRRSGLALTRVKFAAVSVLALLLAPTAAAAQHGGYGRPADASCPTGPITSIFIDNHSIFDTHNPKLDPRFDWAYRLANSLHFRTHRDVIARELLFTDGDCYDPMLAQESGRLLRELPFLSRVDVFGIRQPDGSYHVVVDTQDDWSTLLGMHGGFHDGLSLVGAELREENLLGTGQQVRVFYADHPVSGEWGIDYATPQFAATRWNLLLGVGATRVGSVVSTAFDYPFVGEVGRWAARLTYSQRNAYFDFARDGVSRIGMNVLLPVRDQAFDVAALRRIGPPGNVTVIGAGLSADEIGYPEGPGGIIVTQARDRRTPLPADSATVATVWNGLHTLNDVRGLIYFGQRNIWWVQRRGLDAVHGLQDVRLGADVQFGLGRTLPGFERENDVYSTMDLYSAFELGGVLFAIRGRGLARRNLNAPPGQSEWQDVLATGEVLAYWKPGGSTHQTLFFRAAGTGGWHNLVPFQLTLGGDGALRGYDPTRFPGSRRIHFTVEDRSYFGWPLRDVFDLGGTLFADAGQMWAGDAPFGVNSGWQASAGFGLRAAFPAGSRMTYRADIAFPIEPGGLAVPRFMLSVGEVFGLDVPFGDHQLLRSRPNDTFGEVFNLRRP